MQVVVTRSTTKCMIRSKIVLGRCMYRPVLNIGIVLEMKMLYQDNPKLLQNMTSNGKNVILHYIS